MILLFMLLNIAGMTGAHYQVQLPIPLPPTPPWDGGLRNFLPGLASNLWSLLSAGITDVYLNAQQVYHFL
jgi:hypothetical protein